MADEEYKLQQWSSRSLYYSFPGGGYHDEISSVLKKVENDLNRLYDENLFLKAKESERDEELLGLHHRVRELNEENEQLKKELDCFKPLIFETDGMPITLYEKKDGGDVE